MMRLARMTLILCCAALGAGVAGCAPLPDLAAASRAPVAPAPVLVPLDGILAQADALGESQTAVGTVDARAAQLRAKADRLRSQ